MRIVVLISGSGTNLQAILDAIAQGQLKTEMALVVSNRKAAFGLERASRAGVPTLYFPLKPYTGAGRSREAYETDLAEKIGAYRPDLVVMAGWMHVLGAAFLDRFAGRIVNLHPALPGMFPGTNAIERAYEAYLRGEVTHSGCMVHHAVPEVDAGPVIAQEIVPIEPGDTLEDFSGRMHAAEHRIIVQAISTYLTR